MPVFYDQRFGGSWRGAGADLHGEPAFGQDLETVLQVTWFRVVRLSWSGIRWAG